MIISTDLRFKPKGGAPMKKKMGKGKMKCGVLEKDAENVEKALKKAFESGHTFDVVQEIVREACTSEPDKSWEEELKSALNIHSGEPFYHDSGDEFHDISVGLSMVVRGSFDFEEPTIISQVGLVVFAGRNFFDIKLRMTPLDDVQDIAGRLSEEEGDLCIAGPSIDIEDVEVLPSKSEVIKFRHNI